MTTGQYNIQDVGDIMMFENLGFIADDDFISSKEFDTFLYQHKGTQVRAAMKDKT